ncbi:MAG: putative mycofactocin-associated electron transfer flavoprotein [Actinobacteria bacterium]|nr:putative mycofactocin-associated electron transfer flavoprotein [Actinomycetota bacterium]
MIAACLKWVDHRPEVDLLTGEVRTDERSSGASDADRAALEWALRAAQAWGDEVVAVTAGPPAADAMLREAVAAGADRAVRIDLRGDAPSDEVAAALAVPLAGFSLVVCGDWSIDRGSGSVPAFVAAILGAAQALGLVRVTVEAQPGALTVERRLDGGRREHLRLTGPAVCSVEPASARLRRASLDGVLAARRAAIEVVVPAVARRHGAGHAVHQRPYRPRARVLPAPSASSSPRERVLALTGALSDRTPPETLVLDPPAAAERLMAQLRAWGYLEGGGARV